MTFPLYNLWCQVLWCTTKCLRILIGLDVFLGKTEICQFCIAILIN